MVEHDAKPKHQRRRVYDSRQWRRVRLEAIERDQVCQSHGPHGGPLTVHHITAISDGGEPYNLANLVTLCRTCHARVEGRQNKGGASRAHEAADPIEVGSPSPPVRSKSRKVVGPTVFSRVW